MPPSNAADVETDLFLAVRADHVWERLGWLIRLRWVAITGVIAVIVVAAASGAIADARPMVGIVAVLAMANVAYGQWRAHNRSRRRLGPLERHAMTELLVDVSALTALLHWSDGAENPFAMFFAFHVALAGKLLPPSRAYAVAGAAIAMQCGTVFGEHIEVLGHHQLFVGAESAWPDEVIESRLFLGGYLTAFSLTLLGTVYFVASATQRFHDELAKRVRVERVAASRARLANLGELSAGVAHSIRNPLHGVLNCVDLLRAQVPSTDESDVTLALMDLGLHRIEAITHRLLSLTRDAPIQVRPADIRDLVDEALRFVRAGGPLGAPQVERLPGPGIVAEVDPDRLCEAVANVVDNAIDASREGGKVTVAVSLSDGFAVIEVCDTGEGIPAADLARVFDPFFTTKAIGEGTGLGLAITRRVVEDHGGTVVIRSDAGGTCVRLALPASPLARELQDGGP